MYVVFYFLVVWLSIAWKDMSRRWPTVGSKTQLTH